MPNFPVYFFLVNVCVYMVQSIKALFWKSFSKADTQLDRLKLVGFFCTPLQLFQQAEKPHVSVLSSTEMVHLFFFFLSVILLQREAHKDKNDYKV